MLSIDYSEQPPAVYLGAPVLLGSLKIAGLRPTSTKKDQGRHFNCPRCAARVDIKLDTTQALTCPSLRLAHRCLARHWRRARAAMQKDPVKPLVPLGKIATLAGSKWQLVGFQHRMGIEPDDDEYFGWDEYLLYHSQQGFQFLVNSSEGWSLVKTLTGAPDYRAGRSTATWKQQTYQAQSRYRAETTMCWASSTGQSPGATRPTMWTLPGARMARSC